MSAYSKASKDVFEVFRRTTPLVEGISIDEAFLDVGGLRRVSGDPATIAARLRQDVLDSVGLRITVGVARTKFLAKVASGVAKPDGLLVVPPAEELTFLHPLPVQRLWGVGPKSTAKLHELGIYTVGQVAGLGEAGLVSILGQASGRHLHALAHNRDPRRVRNTPRRRSIGSQHAMGRARHRPEDIDAVVMGLVDRVTGRMRKGDRTGRTVVLRLRFDDFSRVSRSHTLPRATADTATILATVRSLVRAATPLIETRGLTLVGIAVGNLDDESLQLELPFDERNLGALDSALDGVRERFGSSSVTRAVLLHRRQHIEMPLLPE
jgi:DNA polymerase-4